MERRPSEKNAPLPPTVVGMFQKPPNFQCQRILRLQPSPPRQAQQARPDSVPPSQPDNPSSTTIKPVHTLTYGPSVKPTREGPCLEHPLSCLFHKKTPNLVLNSVPMVRVLFRAMCNSHRGWTTTAALNTLPTDPTVWDLLLFISPCSTV